MKKQIQNKNFTFGFNFTHQSTQQPAMDDFRSRSSGDLRMEIEAYGSRVAPSSSAAADPHGLRCYSTSHVSYPSSSSSSSQAAPKEMKLKKGKSTSGGWILSDPELQRKKRVAGYKAIALEGKMKGSLRKSFRWIKDRCSQVVTGKW